MGKDVDALLPFNIRGIRGMSRGKNQSSVPLYKSTPTIKKGGALSPALGNTRC
jgi:hypothetical protein